MYKAGRCIVPSEGSWRVYRVSARGERRLRRESLEFDLPVAACRLARVSEAYPRLDQVYLAFALLVSLWALHRIFWVLRVSPRLDSACRLPVAVFCSATCNPAASRATSLEHRQVYGTINVALMPGNTSPVRLCNYHVIAVAVYRILWISYRRITCVPIIVYQKVLM